MYAIGILYHELLSRSSSVCGYAARAPFVHEFVGIKQCRGTIDFILLAKQIGQRVSVKILASHLLPKVGAALVHRHHVAEVDILQSAGYQYFFIAYST